MIRFGMIAAAFGTALLAVSVCGDAASAKTMKAAAQPAPVGPSLIAGSPIRDGRNCYVTKSADFGYGYWDKCAK